MTVSVTPSAQPLGGQQGKGSHAAAGPAGDRPVRAGRRGSLPAEESEALKQALLGNLREHDEEGAGDMEAPPVKQSRSWTSLLGTALVFVWPDDFVLQAIGVHLSF